MSPSLKPASGKIRGVVFLAAITLASCLTALDAQTVSPSSSAESPAQAGKQQNAAFSKDCTLPGVSAQRLREVVDATAKLPAPLASDAMIRVAKKVASQCPVLAKDLLQRAFDQADGVEPATAYKLAGGKGVNTDSRIFFKKKTYDLAMDSLSLQSRAVIAMAPLDAKKAIQLFRQMSPPRPPAATCASGFAPDVSVYYDALAKVFASMKAQKPRNDAEAQAPFLLVQEVVSATTSPVQLAPLAKVLSEANLSPTELSPLLSSIAAAVENFPVDDNSFSYWGGYPAAKAKDQLVQLAASKQISTAAFLRSFYDYLDRSLNGAHCAGNEPKDVKELATLYRSFTRTPGNPEQGVDPLHIPDTAPPIEPGPDPGEYWQTPKEKELLLEGKHLNFDDRWQPFTDPDFKTPEWQDRVRHALDDVDNWNASDEASPSDYYHEVEIMLFRMLSRLQPGTTLYDQVLAVWIKTFTESSLQWDNPVEWYIGVSEFLQFSRKDMKGPPPPAAIAVLKNSSNPYLNSIGVLTEFLQ
jgi:hypothetical protein